MIVIWSKVPFLFCLSFKIHAVRPHTHTLKATWSFLLELLNLHGAGRRREKQYSKDRNPRHHPLSLLSFCV
ncbi:hypothetical protein BKA57DRAFT_466583 [Linnemannia elongata]|nr:hypothetical protein BKA57DRAFT_466583 [Linnemannia elongata]